MVTTPLLLVSRDIHTEAKKVLKQTIEHYTKQDKDAIHMHRIVSPSAEFVDLWSRGQLVLEYYKEGSLFFLTKLSKELAVSMRHLVITNALLAADDGPTRAA
jgi:hypothetical protein